MKNVLLLAAVLAAAVPSLAASAPPGAKCPVCGMFVAKYPDWTARVGFRSGETAYFDGAKDMFKFRQNLSRYRPKGNPQEITAMTVNDYYTLKQVDATKAFYVRGSDVYGPMGDELIPFAKKSDAEEFLRDHHGKSVLRYGQVTPALIRELD